MIKLLTNYSDNNTLRYEITVTLLEPCTVNIVCSCSIFWQSKNPNHVLTLISPTLKSSCKSKCRINFRVQSSVFSINILLLIRDFRPSKGCCKWTLPFDLTSIIRDAKFINNIFESSARRSLNSWVKVGNFLCPNFQYGKRNYLGLKNTNTISK